MLECRGIKQVDPGVVDAGKGKLYTLAVTSMHICARIFAWAWDFFVGSGAYPMQHVSFDANVFKKNFQKKLQRGAKVFLFNYLFLFYR